MTRYHQYIWFVHSQFFSFAEAEGSEKASTQSGCYTSQILSPYYTYRGVFVKFLRPDRFRYRSYFGSLSQRLYCLLALGCLRGRKHPSPIWSISSCVEASASTRSRCYGSPSVRSFSLANPMNSDSRNRINCHNAAHFAIEDVPCVFPEDHVLKKRNQMNCHRTVD